MIKREERIEIAAQFCWEGDKYCPDRMQDLVGEVIRDRLAHLSEDARVTVQMIAEEYARTLLHYHHEVIRLARDPSRLYSLANATDDGSDELPF